MEEKREITGEANSKKHILFFGLYPGFLRAASERSSENSRRALILKLCHGGTACSCPDPIYNVLPVTRKASKASPKMFCNHSTGGNTNLVGSYESANLFHGIEQQMLDMNPESVLLKAMWIMGKTDDTNKVRRLSSKNMFSKSIGGSDGQSIEILDTQ